MNCAHRPKPRGRVCFEKPAVICAVATICIHPTTVSSLSTHTLVQAHSVALPAPLLSELLQQQQQHTQCRVMPPSSLREQQAGLVHKPNM